MKLTGVGILLLMTATTAPAGDKFPKCFDAARDGHCVAIQVNGQKSVKLSGKTKKMLKGMGALSLHGSEIRYEVPQAVRGDLVLTADWLPEAVDFFGAQPEVGIIVYPLEGQNLDTRPELSTEPSVQISGSAAVTRSDVIQGNRLPPGKYVLAVRVHGSRQNWDRQNLFVQVVD
jgi:hypothetical protein